jgi:hypothetical protein
VGCTQIKEVFSFHHQFDPTMQKITVLVLFLAALPLFTAAQDCADMYDYFKEGVTLEYTNYGKKGKVESVTTQRISRVEESADTLIAVIEATSVSEKNKKPNQFTFPIKCHAGTIFVDMRSVVPQQDMGDMPDLEIEINGTDLTYPPDLKVGQTLPDSEMEFTMRMGGMQIMNTKYFITNRKVETRENVTTTAGTYDCFKISYDFEYTLMGKRTSHTEYWYAPSVGMVKSVSYDKKGNEDSRMELTKFSK